MRIFLSGVCRTIGMALLGALVLPGGAYAETASRPPDLDCGLGFTGLHTYAGLIPGAQSDDETRTVRAESPDSWRVEFGFSAPGDAAHPAVTLRTFIKQVTGVWTAQSKGCGFGDQAAFASVMADMKATDTQLTNASRGEVEQQKKDASPLGN